ncbi:MAG: ACT domain-containing protein, partial [Candidatus Methanomethylophilus sp.]|nr:ACT domain-containing protein [Methanomethylophilus sp.]
MAKQTFILSAPDRPGTLRRAAVAVAAHHGNIVRLSYNKAVDVRTVFLDVEAEPADLQALSGELADMGYLASERPASVVVTVSLSMADRPGEL